MKLLRLLLLHIFCFINLCLVYSQDLNWVKTVGGGMRDDSRDIAYDENENIIIVGKHGGGDFDPGPNQYILNTGINVTPSFYYDAFVAKYNSSGDLLWAHSTGDSYNDEAIRVSIDNDGNILVVGYAHNNMDLDPGPNVVMSNVGNGYQYPFLQKFDPDGNLLWAKALKGSCDEFGGMDVAIDNDNNIIWGVQTNGFECTILGNLEYFSSKGGKDAYVLKLNSSGSILWCKSLGSSQDDKLKTLAVDHNNNIIVGGESTYTPIFDTASASISLPPTQKFTNSHAYLLKLNSSGNLQWAKNIDDIVLNESFSYLTRSQTEKIGIDASNNIYGYILDPGNGSANPSDFLFKFDHEGNKLWAKKILETRQSTQYVNDGFDVDDEGNIYRSYNFFETTDANPGIGINNFTCTRICGGYSPHIADGIMIHKLDSNGNYIWGRALESCSGDIYGLKNSKNNKILITGIYEAGFDFAPLHGPILSTDHSSPDIFFASIDQLACSNLALIIDSVSSLNCVDSALIQISGQDGVSPYLYSFKGGVYQADTNFYSDSSGFYNLSVIDFNGCKDSTLIHLTAPTVLNGYDLNVNLIAEEFRPGFYRSMTIDAYSEGCDTVSGRLMLVMDTLVDYQSSNPVVTQIIGDTLIWDFDPLNYDSLHFTPIINFLTNISAEIGDSVCFKLILTPDSMDIYPFNNIKEYCYPIVNGYDPNDIAVYPVGKCEEHFVEEDQKLTYTIRFQNTGNSEAINIRIKNIISDKLDLKTLRVISSSDYVITELSENRELNFIFSSIHLPDATNNEPESHGYVIYEIYPYSNLNQNDEIENSANIFFDFNPPILTNTVQNAIFKSDLESWECYKNTNESFMVLAPNPSTNEIQFLLPKGDKQGSVSIYSINGHKVFNQYLNSGEIINLEKFTSGIYFLVVTTENSSFCEKFIKIGN